MSVKLMNLAWTLAIPNASAKIVLLALADHANDDGTSCFPQIETICKKCGLTYRGVTKILEQLKTNGHITVVSGRGRHRSNNYKVHPDPTRKWEPRSYFKHGENRNETTRKWERGDTKIGTDEQENRNDVPTYPSVPIIEPSLTTSGTASIVDANASTHFAMPPETKEVDDVKKENVELRESTRLSHESQDDSEKKKKDCAQKEKESDEAKEDDILRRIMAMPTVEKPPEAKEENDEAMTDEEWEEWRTMSEECIWAKYPKHRAKKELKADFMLLIRREVKDDELTAVWKGLGRWLSSVKWREEAGQYVPSPLKFLDEERWKYPPQPKAVPRWDY